MKRYITIIALLCLGLKAQAQVNQNRIQVPSFQFENFIYDARSAGLGDGGIAISPDINSGFLNPAKLPFLYKSIYRNNYKSSSDSSQVISDSTDTNHAISISYSPYARNLVDDMNLFGGNFIYTRKNDAFGLSAKYFLAGKINLTDENAISYGTATSQEFALTGSYAKKLSERSSLAIGIKYIYSNLLAKQSLASGVSLSAVNTFAADIYYYHSGKKYEGQHAWLNYGASLTNIGGKVSYDDYSPRNFQPTTLRLGLAEHLALGNKNTLALSLDAYRLLIPTPPVRNAAGKVISGKDPETISALGTIFESWSTAPDGFSETLKEINYNLGAELTLQNLLVLRAGYFYQNKDKGNMQFVTLGLGLKLKKVGLDISYLVPTRENNPLAHTLRFGISIGF